MCVCVRACVSGSMSMLYRNDAVTAAAEREHLVKEHLNAGAFSVLGDVLLVAGDAAVVRAHLSRPGSPGEHN